MYHHSHEGMPGSNIQAWRWELSLSKHFVKEKQTQVESTCLKPEKQQQTNVEWYFPALKRHISQ